MKKNLLFILLIAMFFYSCSKDENSVEPVVSTTGILIVNEGGFGQNNSTLSYYDFEKQISYKDVYGPANDGAFLGDVANSVEIFEGKAYIAVNGSQKIEIVDLANFKSLGFIDLGPGSSPRELVIINSTSGYVTSFGTKLYKFNPTTRAVVSSIEVGANPEGIVQSNGKLFIARSGDFMSGYDNKVIIVDINTDAVIDSVIVGVNPRITMKNDAGDVFVVCTGTYFDATNGKGGIYKINPITNQAVDSFIIFSNPGEACIANDKIYVVNSDGVLSIDLLTGIINATPVINGMAVNSMYGVVYSIAFDPIGQKIYCGNPKDFVQDGEIVVYDLDYNEINRFDVGINPGVIQFLY